MAYSDFTPEEYAEAAIDRINMMLRAHGEPEIGNDGFLRFFVIRELKTMIDVGKFLKIEDLDKEVKETS